MRKRIFWSLDREFVELSGEARTGATVEEETADLLRRFVEELKQLELSWENIVRTRLWCRDRETRTPASVARSKILPSSAKASSASYISLLHFDSNAKVAMDLLAMRPSHPSAERNPAEFEPPRAYLRYLCFDSILFFSGYTSNADTFEVQVSQVLEAVDSSLVAAGTDWGNMAKLTIFLHRSQKLEMLRSLLAKANKLDISKIEFGFVDGYAGEKNLLEAEATATLA